MYPHLFDLTHVRVERLLNLRFWWKLDYQLEQAPKRDKVPNLTAFPSGIHWHSLRDITIQMYLPEKTQMIVETVTIIQIRQYHN